MTIVPVELWRHEMRRCGPVALGTPVAVASCAALVAVMAGGGMREFLAVRLPGALLPLVAGVCAVGVMAREVMPELQCTFATPYPVTVRRRLWLLVIAVGLGAGVLGLSAAAGAATGPDVAGQDTAGSGAVLSPVASAAAFSLLLIGLGGHAAAGRAQPGPAAALVMTAWLAKLLVLDRIPLPSAAVAAAFTVAGVWLLIRGSIRAGGEAV